MLIFLRMDGFPTFRISMKEINECFFNHIQLVLGLRYIHKEKHIIHRDLTPNNIMLGENDKVTISKYLFQIELKA